MTGMNQETDKFLNAMNFSVMPRMAYNRKRPWTSSVNKCMMEANNENENSISTPLSADMLLL